MRVTRNALMRQCALCERTILLGERTVRFAPHEGDDFVDVCPLCQEIAVEQGWVREGSPVSVTVAEAPRRGRLSLSALLGTGARRAAEAPVATEPILRRLSEPELALVEAADLFNASPHRRTVGGIAKSLGLPRASIVPLGGLTGELVLTIAWDISWYQYRVTPESAQPVRLEERGHELDDLDDSFRAWNARVEDEGRLVPQIANL